MSNKLIKSSLKHYGVQGMKWGVRKDYKKVKKSTASRKTLTNQTFQMVISQHLLDKLRCLKNLFEIANEFPGTKIFNMTTKLSIVIITPSEKEEVEIQLELLKNKKVKDLFWAMAPTKRIEEATGYKNEVEYENYLKKIRGV